MALTTDQLAAYFASFPKDTPVMFNSAERGDVDFTEDEPVEVFIPISNEQDTSKTKYVVCNTPT